MTAVGGATPAPSRAPALLLGLGLGGFVDGIVLHQVLQWHHLVSDVEAYPTTTVAGLEVNTLADGFFHLVVSAVLVVAGLALYRRGVAALTPARPLRSTSVH